MTMIRQERRTWIMHFIESFDISNADGAVLPTSPLPTTHNRFPRSALPQYGRGVECSGRVAGVILACRSDDHYGTKTLLAIANPLIFFASCF
jgi:hypothetical protein